jgi:hypothetical protein
VSALLRRLGVSLLVGLAGSLVVVGCSSFGADTAGAPASEAGPTADSPAPSGDATVADGPTTDAGDATTTFTEHFDVPGWEGSWDLGNKGALVADSTGAQSAPSSLHVQLAKAAVHNEIVRGYSAPSKLRVKASIYIVTQGDGDVDFVALSDNLVPSLETSVSFSATTSGFVGELYDTPKSAVLSKFTLGIVSGKWIDLELEVDLVLRTWSMWQGGMSLGTDSLPSTWKPTTLFVKVGAAYTSSVTQPWDLRIDDVVVTATGP